ncbi:MAG TPA: glycoside hydrolase family 88 protein [Pyrinomonadaceae bacterium]|jgi:rhamnogalacturonyl hydrolase YesR
MRRLRKAFALSLAALTLLGSARAARAADHFKDWPAGASPAEVGKRVAENWAARTFEFEQMVKSGGVEKPRRQFVIYPEVCAWYGSLTVARLTKDRDLTARLYARFDRFLTPEGDAHVSRQAHVDYSVFGAVPLEIYIQTKDRRHLDLGRGFADRQWAKTTPDGITAEARYWVDDMYMINALQAQAFRATGDRVYLDRAAQATAAYLDRLQQPNGLFHHAPDSPFYWGRGNGWYAAGMAELLRSLPKNHPRRARIMQGFRTMMAALLKYQAEDGLWRQLVDRPDVWAETSGTGMFAFALVTGVKEGWLDAKTYGPAARRAWLGLVKHVDAEANVTDVCVGTNKAFQEVGPDLDKQLKFYLERDRKTGDLHGQAPVLWTATALLR